MSSINHPTEDLARVPTKNLPGPIRHPTGSSTSGHPGTDTHSLVPGATGSDSYPLVGVAGVSSSTPSVGPVAG